MDSELEIAQRVYSSIFQRNIHNMKDLQSIVKINPNIILPDKGMNILHLAVGIDPVEYAENVTYLLLNYGCNPNERSDESMTALHIACAWGRQSIVKILLDNGADPYLRDNDNKLPLDYATENGHLDIIDCLFDYYQNDNDCSDSSESYILKLDKVIIDNGSMLGEYKTFESNEINSCTLLSDVETDDSLVSCVNKDRTFMTDGKSSSNNSNDLNSKNSFNNGFCNESSMKNNVTKCSSDYHSCNDLTIMTNDSSDSDCRNCNTLSDGSFLTGIATLKFTRNDFNDYSVFHESDDHKIEFEPSVINKSVTKLDTIFPNSPVPVPHHNYCSQTTLNTKRGRENDDAYQMETRLQNDTFNSLKNEENPKFPAILNLSFKNVSAVNVTSQLPNPNTTKSIIEEYKYEDKQAGIVLIEKRILSSSVFFHSNVLEKSEQVSRTSSLSSLPMSVDYDTDRLRNELILHGISPGPITTTTKKVYLNKLYRLKKETPLKVIKCPDVVKGKTYTIELEKSLRDFNWINDLSSYMELENKIVKQFETPDPRKRWREGIIKSSFTYLLMDPRVTENLPSKADNLPKHELWKLFLNSIFYVGKGKRSRPYSHLYQAVTLYNAGQLISSDKKVQYILDIWKENLGVVCLHIFQNVIPAEAYTREAAMIEVISLKNLKNIKPGNYYGVASTWSLKEKKHLGVYLLYRAMLILLNEGERQLKPVDIG